MKLNFGLHSNVGIDITSVILLTLCNIFFISISVSSDNPVTRGTNSPVWKIKSISYNFWPLNYWKRCYIHQRISLHTEVVGEWVFHLWFCVKQYNFGTNFITIMWQYLCIWKKYLAFCSFLHSRPICRLLKRGTNLRNGGGNLNSDFEAKIKDVNSVSGEKLHNF